MIDISTIKLLTMITGSSVALLSMLELNTHRNTESDARMEIRKVIELFVKAGDAQNTDQLDTVLHDHFRVIANQLMGSSAISVITKDQYLALMREGKLGGDSRILDIQSLEVIGKNASAKVKITGKTLTFESFYHLIQNNEGQWQLVQDLPFATKN
jgi:Putative lumazine-binding